MTFFQKLFFLLWRAFQVTWVWLGLYGLWSKVYRFVAEGHRHPIRDFADLSDLVRYLRDMKWRPDTWRQLWDAVSHPEHVQYLADTDPQRFIGDCDDFAAYEMEVIETQLKNHNSWGIVGANMMSVGWYQPGQGIDGHNVCLLRYGDGTYAYMDYEWPSQKRGTIREVMTDVLNRRCPGATLVFWSVMDRNLRVKEIHCQ